MPFHPLFDTMAIEINHATCNEIRRTINKVHTIETSTIVKLFNGDIAEHQRQQHHHPSRLLVIEQECEEREQHIEREHRSQEPSYTNHLDVWIRQEIETHRQVGEALAESAPRWFHHKTYHHHHGEERPRAVIPLGIKLGRSYRSRLHSLIITTTHRECADYHKEQGEIGEPRYHLTSQEVITWLSSHISHYVHQHDSHSSIGTQTIQRRVIFSDILRYGGG